MCAVGADRSLSFRSHPDIRQPPPLSDCVAIETTAPRAARRDDDMRQEARFASHNANETIINHLRATADSLELPADAQRIAIRRSQSAIIIEAAYTEYVEFPMYVRQIVFHPYAESTF